MFLSVNVKAAQPVANTRYDGEVPVYRYRKEIIRTGEYYKEADNLAFTVTRSVLDHWVDTFKEYSFNGNKVTIPETHEAMNTPSENRGWVLDMFRDGDSLFAIMELYGADAPKIAATNDVSIYSPANFTDGLGVEYSRPILHVALCTNPVVPGLNKFEAIAASLKSFKKETNMNVKRISAALGLEFKPDDNDDQKEDLVVSAIEDLKKKKAADEELDEDGNPIKAAQTPEEKAAEEKAAEEKKKSVSASRSRRAIDPLVVKLTAENRRLKLGNLLELGKITPVVMKDMIAEFVESKDLAASLSAGNDSFDAITSILMKNDPVVLAQQTRAQILELNDSLKGNGKNPLIADAEARAAKK